MHVPWFSQLQDDSESVVGVAVEEVEAGVGGGVVGKEGLQSVPSKHSQV